MLEKRLAAYLRALLPLAFQQPLHHHLRRDTRMVCADDPERILALQPRVADQYILQCVVERMADVERARHIGRRNHDSERLRIGPFGRSEEHTSELQSLMRISYAVFCLKKKNKTHIIKQTIDSR